MSRLKKIKEVPNIKETGLYRCSSTGDPKAGSKAFQGMRDLGIGGFVILRFVGDDDCPVLLHPSEGVLVIRDSFVVRENDPMLT
jgi:hypothetical protein